jgi:hypothetical protein
MMAALLALVTPQVFYLMWDGQIDGLVLIGLLFLPWSSPLVLLRPQILGWYCLAKKRWTIGMLSWLAFSLVVWGNWLTRSLAASRGSVEHPTAMGWYTLGFPIFFIGLGMMFGAGGNPTRFLAGCILASPYLQPYHMVLLLPAIGEVGGWKRWTIWGWAWVVGLVPAFMGITRYLALGFPICVWWLLREQNRDPA